MKNGIVKNSIMIAIILLAILFVDWIPADVEVRQRMAFTELRIQEYAALNKTLPQHLEDLPIPPDKDARTIDNWGMSFIYSPQPNGSVILTCKHQFGKTGPYSIQFPIVSIDNQQKFMANAYGLEYLWKWEDAIRYYVKKYHYLPLKLSDVADISSDSGLPLIDGWWEPVLYHSNADGTIILSCQGKWGPNAIFSLIFSIPGASLPTTDH